MQAMAKEESDRFYFMPRKAEKWQQQVQLQQLHAATHGSHQAHKRQQDMFLMTQCYKHWVRMQYCSLQSGALDPTHLQLLVRQLVPGSGLIGSCCCAHHAMA